MQHHEGAAQPRGLRRLRPEHSGPSSGETWRSILADNSHFGTASASVQVALGGRYVILFLVELIKS